jgi:hypothetical protein
MAHEINIHVNKAQIEGFSIDLKDKMPEAQVTIGLYADDKKITTFNCYDESSYYSGVKFKFTPGMIRSIKTLAKNLENAVMLAQNRDLLQLEAG